MGRDGDVMLENADLEGQRNSASQSCSARSGFFGWRFGISGRSRKGKDGGNGDGMAVFLCFMQKESRRVMGVGKETSWPWFDHPYLKVLV